MNARKAEIGEQKVTMEELKLKRNENEGIVSLGIDEADIPLPPLPAAQDKDPEVKMKLVIHE